MKNDLRTRLVSEFLGTGLLVLAVTGSGAMAEQLTDDTAMQLLANSLATAGALVTLIWLFAPLSGAHFNPVVTVAQCILQSHRWKLLAPYIVVQILGGLSGAVVANLMFSLDALGPSTKVREGGGIWLGEVVATFALLLVIHVIGKSNPSLVPPAVGIWIGGAYWFTSSTSLANPAVTTARSFTDSFAGIAPQSVPAFITAQVAGLALAIPVIKLLNRRV